MSNEFLGSNQTNLTKSRSVTQELVVTTKNKILKGKLKFLKENTQTEKLSKTLDLVSIGTDQALTQFWSKSTMGMSKQLWSPTKTECVDLDYSLWNGSSKNLMLNSWFSTRIMNSKTHLQSSQKIYFQSLQSLLPKIMALEQENIEEKEKKPKKKKRLKKKKKQAEKAIKIRIYPTKDQKITLKEWFGVTRFIYNKCLYEMNKNKDKKLTLKELRKRIINNDNYKEKDQWMLKYEYDLRDEALQDLLKNIKSNLEKGNKFEIKYKRKKDKENSISVLAKKWNKKNNFYSCIFKPNLLKSSENLPSKLMYTSRLMVTSTKKYYLAIPKPLKMVGENQALKNSMIFLDPGVKNFLTGYDPSGKVIVFGERDIGRIARLLHYKRKINSKMSKANHKKKINLKKAMLIIFEKIRNLVSEMHKKLTKWLCENYTNIYLPRLNFHKCKNLNKKSKEKMASLSHCKFIERLINKTREYSSTKVYEVNEAFTSKTCSNCGNQKENLGNKDDYYCDNCNLKIGRDINASKNIMLRYFTKRAKLS